MTFFTGKGDKGTTTLFDSRSGMRVSKSAAIFECLGQLDELNAIVGWCKVACPEEFRAGDERVRDVLLGVQNHLFTIQAEAAGAKKSIPLQSIETISAFITQIERTLPQVKTFLISGGTELSSRFDIARAVSRRAERRLVTLHESGEREVSETSRAYMNRLSSLFYALTRLENHRVGVTETPPSYKS